MSPTAGPARRRLRTRLIAWYAGSLCCVLLIGALAVRVMVARALDRAQAESMTASVALFQQFFRVELAEYRTVEATLSHIAAELIFEDRVIDVHRPDGTLFHVAGVPIVSQVNTLRPPVRDLRVALDPMLAPGWMLDVHASGATLSAAARRIDLWLLGGIPLMVFVAALLGWWLAGRALRPIGRMAAEARRLNPQAGARLTLHDPTDELGRFGASFNALLDRLDATQGEQRRFLADAAHELRTPLARLRSRMELARIALATTELDRVRQEATATLNRLEREVIAASASVTGLLALARADAGVAPVTLVNGYLDDVLADELPRWRETAAAHGVQLELGRFEEVHARFDATLLRQLLGLLLDNAIHYSDAGGRVTLHVHADATRVHLVVEDRGIGVPDSERERIFARFHRSAAARARRSDGSGLGLSLARWIMEQHGGTLRATDREDGAPGLALVAEWPRSAVALNASEGDAEQTAAVPSAAAQPSATPSRRVNHPRAEKASASPSASVT